MSIGSSYVHCVNKMALATVMRFISDIIILPAECSSGDYEYVRHDRERYVTLCKGSTGRNNYEQIGREGDNGRQGTRPAESRRRPPILQHRQQQQQQKQLQQNEVNTSAGTEPARPPASPLKRNTSTRRPLPPEPTPGTTPEPTSEDTSVGASPLPTSPTTTIYEEEDTRYYVPDLEERSYSSLSDVPKDVTSLNTIQMAECLGLLKLSPAPCEKLLDSDVDGELLLALDQDVLQREFDFKKFEAIKLCRFAQGWRPKY